MVDYSLYIHLPFCTKKCDYCHFFVLPDNEIYKDRLLNGLKKEWQLLHPKTEGMNLVSIYFGGGTPSLFGPERIEELLSLWDSDCEITLEANPESLTQVMVDEYAAAGINRISIGVQTLESSLLKRLSRTHSAQDSLDAIASAARCIPNITIDLMYDIPGQTLEGWDKTLQTAASLPIQHISLYNLTIEPHTVFHKYRRTIQKLVPNESDSCSMYQLAKERFEQVGLHQYEISAFCQSGFESRHNTGYWLGRPFFGLGPSAFSYWDGARMRNVAHLNKYCSALERHEFAYDFSEKLDPDAALRERLAIALRMMCGVSMKDYQSFHEELQKLMHVGLLETDGNRIRLTQLGVLHYDTVASELIVP